MPGFIPFRDPPPYILNCRMAADCWLGSALAEVKQRYSDDDVVIASIANVKIWFVQLLQGSKDFRKKVLPEK